MKIKLHFLASLSCFINGAYSNEKSESNVPYILSQQKCQFIKSLNYYQNLFERLDHLYHQLGFKNELNLEKNREEYLRLYAQFHQQIENKKYLLSSQHSLAERYEKLFNKYAEKLKKPNLSPKQRRRYEKLWVQYAMLYMEYSHQSSK
jgi:hypothetical protein